MIKKTVSFGKCKMAEREIYEEALRKVMNEVFRILSGRKESSFFIYYNLKTSLTEARLTLEEYLELMSWYYSFVKNPNKEILLNESKLQRLQRELEEARINLKLVPIKIMDAKLLRENMISLDLYKYLKLILEVGKITPYYFMELMERYYERLRSKKNEPSQKPEDKTSKQNFEKAVEECVIWFEKANEICLKSEDTEEYNNHLIMQRKMREKISNCLESIRSEAMGIYYSRNFYNNFLKYFTDSE